MSNHDVEIAVRVTLETKLAYKVDHGGKEEVWVPKSLRAKCLTPAKTKGR